MAKKKKNMHKRFACLLQDSRERDVANDSYVLTTLMGSVDIQLTNSLDSSSLEAFLIAGPLLF